MVDYCRTIEDRDERQACAETIAAYLCRLLPDEMNAREWPSTKAWDTIQILADFDLDVDFPCPVITEENVRPTPERVPYLISQPRMRVYGRIIDDMAKAVCKMEEGPDKEEAVWRIAMQMKKSLFLHNPEAADDFIVFRDLCTLTNGAINLNPEIYHLRNFIAAEQPAAAKNAKKKKKKK